MLGYNLDITLLDTHPKIERKITISKSTTFRQLHEIIEVLFGFSDTNKYVFHINEDVRLFEYSDVGYCYDDVYECSLDEYFKENFTYGYEYRAKSIWLVKIHVKDQIDDALNYPQVKSIKGKYNPSKISDITTFNQILLYKKNPSKYPIELYEDELNSIEVINKQKIQERLNKLFNIEKAEDENIIDSTYSLDKYLNM